MKTASRFESFPAYQPIEPFDVISARLGRPIEDIVKLDANENPYGPAPKARQALAELAFANIYPDPESRALRASLSRFTGTPAEHLLAGSGADELIDLLLRVLLEPGERVLTCPPTFPMYAFDTLLNQGQIVSVPRRPDFSLDLAGIQAAVARHSPKVLFLANPNNPDGSLIPPQVIEELLELPLLLVLDEAYIEFTETGGRLGERLSRIKAVPARQNLVVLRTFSKWAGLAGLRCGYGAFPAWLMPALWKAKQPYNVNVAASTAAIASSGRPGLAGRQRGQAAAGTRLPVCSPSTNPLSRTSAVPGQLHPLPGQRAQRGRAEAVAPGAGHPGALLQYAAGRGLPAHLGGQAAGQPAHLPGLAGFDRRSRPGKTALGGLGGKRA